MQARCGGLRLYLPAEVTILPPCGRGHPLEGLWGLLAPSDHVTGFCRAHENGLEIVNYLDSIRKKLLQMTMSTELENTLQARNIQPTAMRLLVLSELVNRKKAISLNELELALERSDRVTLYRTLKTFQKNKLVHSIEDGTGSVKYALCAEDCECVPADLHAHFHCNHCNATFCLNEYHLPSISLPRKFVMQEMSMVIKGLCESCSV